MKQIWEWIKGLFKPKTVAFSFPAATGFFQKKVEIYKMVRKTAGGHHAIYETNVGLIRKPIQ